MALAISAPRGLLAGVAGVATALLVGVAGALRRFGLILLEELVFREGHVRAIEDGAPFATRRAEKFRRNGADRRIQPELDLRDWRGSPVGEACPAC
jgi:hypothetical protein